MPVVAVGSTMMLVFSSNNVDPRQEGEPDGRRVFCREASVRKRPSPDCERLVLFPGTVTSYWYSLQTTSDSTSFVRDLS